MNRVYLSLIDAQLGAFAADFTDTARNIFYEEGSGRLIHPGEFGSFREGLVRSLLAAFLPELFGISQGFVISPDGAVSTQCDIVIYSRMYAPVIQSAEQQRFFPVEAVVAVGEVKSNLTRAELEEACAKLRTVKEMRAGLRDASIAFSVHRDLGPYSAKDCLLDQLATFVVANEVGCNVAAVNRAVDDAAPSDPSLRVNLVLDVQRWCSAYRDLRGLLWPYPVDVDSSHRVVPDRLPLELCVAGEDRLSHFRVFLHFIQLLVTRTTVLHSDFSGYWGR